MSVTAFEGGLRVQEGLKRVKECLLEKIMLYLITTNHSSTENGPTEWASFGLGSRREGGCPGPLPGARWSSGEIWARGHRGIFLEEEKTELPALEKTAKKEKLLRY